MLFEAPARSSRCGSSGASAREVNLGNIAPDDVLSLETLRLGLRSDTADLTLPPR